MSPTKRQLDLLRFIHGFRLAHFRSPYFREMADGMGCAKGQGLMDKVLGLEERGLIRRSPEWPHPIQVVEPPVIPRAPDGAPLYAVPGFGA